MKITITNKAMLDWPLAKILEWHTKKQKLAMPKWVDEFPKNGVKLDADVNRIARRVKQNDFMWGIITAISKHPSIKMTPQEIYKRAVRDVGVYTSYTLPDNEETAKFVKAWQSNGLAWFVEKVDGVKGAPTKFNFYHGSSCYDTLDMKRLVDHLIDDAKELGIDTRTPDEIARDNSLLEVGG